MFPVRLTVLIVAAVLLLIILMQNTEVVTLHFLFIQVQMSQIVLVLLTAILGFIGGYIFAMITPRLRNPQNDV